MQKVLLINETTCLSREKGFKRFILERSLQSKTVGITILTEKLSHFRLLNVTGQLGFEQYTSNEID